MKYLAHMAVKWSNATSVREIFIGPFETRSEAESVEKMEHRIDYLAPSTPTLSGVIRIHIGDVCVGDIPVDSVLGHAYNSPSIKEVCDMVDKSLGEHFDIVEVSDDRLHIIANPFGAVTFGTMGRECWYIKMPTCNNILCGGNSPTTCSGHGYIYIGPYDSEDLAANAATNIPIEWIHETTMPGISRGTCNNPMDGSSVRTIMGTVKLGTMRIGDNFYCGRHMTKERANEVAAAMRAESHVVKVSKSCA